MAIRLRVVINHPLGELARFRAFAFLICKPAEFDFRQTCDRCGAGKIPIDHFLASSEISA
jgi:hypothetical protein